MTGTAVVPVGGEADAMARIVAMVVVAVALAGCATEAWHRPGATEADARADMAACESAVQRSGAGSGIYGSVTGYDYFHRCMAARGYHAEVF